jgi:hypothetical protein
LHKQRRQFLQVQAAKVAQGPMLREIACPSTRKATSSCSFLAILREENTPVA